MEYFKKILRYAIPYKGYAWLNIVSNIFYAFFGALAFVSLIPMLKVLFGSDAVVTDKPEYTGLLELGDYLEDYMNYFVNSQIEQDGPLQALVVMIALVLGTLLLKNLFGYLAMFFITYLRNGVLKDLRNDLYSKTMELPISFYSEKRKGDTLARISSDVLEIQHSFLSI